MKLPKILIAVLIFSLVYSCKESTNPNTVSQMKQVMNIHDEVMPKMGTMAKLAGELSSKEDSTSIGQEYVTARRELQAARDSMMRWMQDFGNKFDTDEIMNGKELIPQKQEWLNEEEERMKRIRDQINTSIESAESLLDASKD
ncbi:MAG: hypothetical protein KJN76_06175 [Eudoraea sp.]|nr:hypothetical protein [Eudoraea sp.]